jgi:SAM-dependent methyltransferase
MSENYDGVADQYDETFKWLIYRIPIEEHSILSALGDVRGKSILEFACGTGHYTRTLLRRGAQVLGVDLSEDMVRVARQLEAQQHLGARYLVQDVATVELEQRFDIVLAVYLLHYAHAREHLASMCRAIARHLAPGGRFVTYQLNPDCAPEPDYYEPYGLRVRLPPHPQDGSPFTFTARVGENVWTPDIAAHWWSWETLEASLREAGLENIRRVPLSVSPAAVAEHGEEPWRPYLERPHCVLIEATRAAGPGR